MSNIISITKGDIDSIKNVIRPFSTVRKEAFTNFIKLSFHCEDAAADKIVETLLKKGRLTQGMYAGFKIIRITPDAMSDMAALDAFEAYVSLLAKVKEADDSAGIYAVKVQPMEYPNDFIFATTTGEIYEVLVYNDSGFQKLAFDQRSDNKVFGDTAKLIVITSQVSEADASAITLDVPHRLALVRTNDGKAACMITDLIGKEANDDK